MSTNRDGLSGFGFFQALPPQDLDGSALTGNVIDCRGYDAMTFVINIGAFTSGGAMSADNAHDIILEHADSAAGTYTPVTSIDMIRVYGQSGAVTSGIFRQLTSYTDGSQIYLVGYRGNKGWARLRFSGNGAPSVMSAAAMAVGGHPELWPVNKVDPDYV